MLYILYENNKQRGFAETDVPYSETFEQEWRQENPTLRLIAILDERNNMLNKAYNDRSAFNVLCRQYGFVPDDYGATFTINGMPYRLTGFKTRNRKYPCILQTNACDGHNLKCSPRYIKALMESTAAVN